VDLEAFLLSAEWRDTARGLELTLWARSAEGPVRALIRGQESVMFVPRGTRIRGGRQAERSLQTLDGRRVDAAYFKTQRALFEERERLRADGVETFEADVKPQARFLMERFVTGGLSFQGTPRLRNGVLELVDPQVKSAPEVTPRLSALSLDIETDGWDGPLLSIALVAEGLEQVLLVGHGQTEREVLEEAFAVIRRVDPDVLLGWNVIDFDLRVLEARCLVHGLPFAIGRAGEAARVLVGDVPIAKVPGRVVLDGVATLRNASMAMERYTLEHVAQQLLGRGKLRAKHVDALAEIRRMHREDPAALAAYNLEDARLVKEIFEHAKLVEFSVARTKLTGLAMDRQGGSVAAFDYLYLPRLHRRGFVAPDVGRSPPTPSPGGHVLDSVPGLYRNVASFDFRSLYPSIIRTFQIDPYGLWQQGARPVQGFEGASFAREGAILPELISHLHHERTRAREAGNEILSTAIKILMNSFYGVLGTPGCRFFDPRLATSITRRGHEIIERSRAWLEAHGRPVIYGDTDSLFVRLDEALSEEAARAEGRRLAEALNAFWAETVAKEHDGLASHLELRFDALYLRFLMPTMRGSEKGSKKRYAGMTREKLVIRGLEAIRTDWTPLAREAQRELISLVFSDDALPRPRGGEGRGEGANAWERWLRDLRAKVLSGALDEKLVYRKRLRRDVEDYAAAPPHVQAAKLMGEDEEGAATEVEYVMTTRGPEPLSVRTAGIDYAHYLEKQLAPAVDVVLNLLGTSYQRIAGSQLELPLPAPAGRGPG
jgi:DNA polymerase-2